eukprot:1189628-Amphidinium_carterae.1
MRQLSIDQTIYNYATTSNSMPDIRKFLNWVLSTICNNTVWIVLDGYAWPKAPLGSMDMSGNRKTTLGHVRFD